MRALGQGFRVTAVGYRMQIQRRKLHFWHDRAFVVLSYPQRKSCH
jgi:hypothetical protein